MGIGYIRNTLDLGEHSVLIKNPVTGQSLNTVVNIIKRIYVKNVNTYYNSGYYCKAKIYTANGKLAVNKKVTFTFNGKNYIVVTDSNGYASFKVASKNFKPKTYTLKVKYLTSEVTRKVVIKHVVNIKSVKKTGSSAKVKILLKGKKVLKNQKISIKFAGKTTKQKTNSKGYVTYNISKKTLSGLKKGKTYSLKVTYLKDTVTAKIKV